MKNNDVIILLGAGASCEAGLKTSAQMTVDLERLLATDEEWKKYQKLYHAIKCGILYGHALNYKSIQDGRVNIEELVNVLTELALSQEHVIYPFIAQWNLELQRICGNDFRLISDFKDAIVKKLIVSWVCFNNDDQASYYSGLLRYAKEHGTTLKVFSLNYDLCVETICQRENVYRGFEKENNEMVWNDQAIDSDDTIDQLIKLYKLHGSIDWIKKCDGTISCVDHPSGDINPGVVKLIFGTTNKLRHEEPFLSLLAAFRHAALHAKLIVTIGYSFADEHINALIARACSKHGANLLSIYEKKEKKAKEANAEKREFIRKLLEMDATRIKVFHLGAREFMQSTLTKQFVIDNMPHEDAPF